MHILGISAFQSDAAAALLVDGRPAAAAQEERFSRIARDPGFPSRAIRYCLAETGLTSAQLDAVVFYEKPLRKFERVLASHLCAFPHSSVSFARNLFLWLGERLWVKSRIIDELDLAPEKVLFTEHQRALAAAAFFTSPFEEAAVLTLDDCGEWATTALGHGAQGELRLLSEVRHPHSLGLVASALTQFLGFVPGEDEEKLEALALRGQPAFAPQLQELVRSAEGGFTVDETAFRFGYDGDALFTQVLTEHLGPPREPGQPLRLSAPDARDSDLAASLQRVLEERVLEICAELHRRVPVAPLCLGGALAVNRHLVARIVADGPFADVHVAPAPGKAGAALGAALDAHHLLGPPAEGRVDLGDVRYLGESVREHAEDGATALGTQTEARIELARRLALGQRLGWVQGRMEFGPVSSGHRCILSGARDADARGKLLSALQYTEAFLPCRIALPAELADELLELPSRARELRRGGRLCAPARESLLTAAPSAVEPDGTVWPLLVEAERDPELHDVLLRSAVAGAPPLLLLADLRPRGSTLVRSEADAVEAFRRSQLDALVVGTHLYDRG